jgi:hypothetical protein
LYQYRTQQHTGQCLTGQIGDVHGTRTKITPRTEVMAGV